MKVAQQAGRDAHRRSCTNTILPMVCKRPFQVAIGILLSLVLLLLVVLSRSSDEHLQSRQPSPTSAPSTAPQPYIFPPYLNVNISRPVMPTVQRAPPGSEKDVRVEFISIGTNVNDISCAHWVSATLAGQSITTAGFGKKTYTHGDKLPILNRTIALQRLRDWDVIIFLDQDTLFTGTDFQPAVDDFIRRSPAHPDDINVRDIRRGAMVAPLRFASDPGCYGPRTVVTMDKCDELFDEMEEAIQNESASYDFEYLWQANITSKSGRLSEMYLNSGFYMARVWAFRELLAAQTALMPELPYRGAVHDCDQSIYVALYLDLRWGELKQGLLGPNAHGKGTPTVNQFGLHYGAIDIWHTNSPTMMVSRLGAPTVRIDASAYGLPFQTSMFWDVVPPRTVERTVEGLLNAIPSPQKYIRDVPLAHANMKNYTSARVAPSLFSFSPRLVDQMPDGHFPALHPSVLHFADINKPPRIDMYVPFFGWHIAFRLEPDQRNRTVDLLRSARINVMSSTLDALTTITLGAHCDTWIDNHFANGAFSPA